MERDELDIPMRRAISTMSPSRHVYPGKVDIATETGYRTQFNAFLCPCNDFVVAVIRSEILEIRYLFASLILKCNTNS